MMASLYMLAIAVKVLEGFPTVSRRKSAAFVAVKGFGSSRILCAQAISCGQTTIESFVAVSVP
ncbi:hypothetical protein D3C71_1939990 [compost metagenome]